MHVGANIQVSTADAHRPHYEVQVCSDPERLGYMVVGAMVSTSNDRNITQAYISNDGGNRWQLRFEEDAALNSFDPSCAYGRNHELFFGTIGFRGEDARTDTFLLRSSDDGEPGGASRPFHGQSIVRILLTAFPVRTVTISTFTEREIGVPWTFKRKTLRTFGLPKRRTGAGRSLSSTYRLSRNRYLLAGLR